MTLCCVCNPFEFESKNVRVVSGGNGDPWFVAADVCDALTITTEQTRRLDDDEKRLRIVHTLGGPQETSVINESVALGYAKPEDAISRH